MGEVALQSGPMIAAMVRSEPSSKERIMRIPVTAFLCPVYAGWRV